MEIKFFLTSQPFNPSVNETPNQVYAGENRVDFIVNKVSAGSVSSIISSDLQGELTHLFALKTKRHFEGVVVGIVGNASNVKDQYSFCYILLKNIQLFCTIVDKNNIEESNRGSNQIQGVLLNGTP